MSGSDFIAAQQQAQARHFKETCPDLAGCGGAPWRLRREDLPFNLSPAIRAAAPAYFRQHRIAWHLHASHGLSSQACCLNYLMPLATRPDVLSTIVGAVLDIPPPTILPVETGPDGAPWFVGFEWTGKADYLNEWGPGQTVTRGANATSADAIVRFCTGEHTETLLIEWKYTESYGAPLRDSRREGAALSANQVRRARYQDRAFAPEGPLRADLGLKLEDLFWEPFYQCLRQQMLAWQMQAAKEDGAERVRVLHISPAGNNALHRVTAKPLRHLGDDAFSVFASLLVDPSLFLSRSTEQVFGPALAALADDPWAAYLRGRYAEL